MTEQLLTEKFAEKRILILGDIMLDRYLYGSVTRISPEAPVPVMDLQSVDNRLGGAGNVALNLKALGCEPILCGLVGNDDEGKFISNALSENELLTSGLIWSEKRRTTLKTRVIAHGQHLLRVDREDRHPLDTNEMKGVKHFIENTLHQGVDAFVFQDYNKGLLNDELIRWCIALCREMGVPTLVDPKKDHLEAYKGVTLFKPNLKEVNELLGSKVTVDLESLKMATARLRETLDQQFTLITLSQHGLFIEERGIGFIEPTLARNIVDVCGAGDTVLSIAAAGIAAGMDMKTIAMLSNLAGGQVCEKVGAVPVDIGKLVHDFTKIRG